MKLLAFGASTSSVSINRRFANFAASQILTADITDLDLRGFKLPLYSSDEERENGIPVDTYRFLYLIQAHDGLVVSLAEHNGSYAAAFKNLYDWASRVEPQVWCGKPMLLLSTSPGGRGGATVMEAAKATFPRMGAELKATFSLPSFQSHFSDSTGITEPTLRAEFESAVSKFAGSF